jgi:hypothetical protein
LEEETGENHRPDVSHFITTGENHRPDVSHFITTGENHRPDVSNFITITSGLWFSPVSSSNTTDYHDIVEMLL